MSATLLDQVNALPMADRIQLVQEIWEGLIETGYSPELTPAQQADLDRRIKDHAANPDDVVSWETIKAGLEKKYGKFQ